MFAMLTKLESASSAYNAINILTLSNVQVASGDDVKRWQPSAFLDFFVAFLDHPQNIFGDLFGMQNLAGIHAVVR